MIPQHYIDDVLARHDIVNVVSQRINLKKTGKNWSATCPFHDEKSPSFSVSQDKQFAYCFGCGWSGSAIRFVQDFDRVAFPLAVRKLAEIAGMAPPSAETKEQLLSAEEFKLRNVMKDERLIIAIGDAMISMGEPIEQSDELRYEQAKARVETIKNRLRNMGLGV